MLRLVQAEDGDRSDSGTGGVSGRDGQSAAVAGTRVLHQRAGGIRDGPPEDGRCMPLAPTFLFSKYFSVLVGLC
jgi:hypothetical protein